MHLCNHWWIFEFHYVWTNDINLFTLCVCVWQILMLEETDSPFFYMKVIGLENLKSIRKDLIQWFSWNYKQLQNRLFLTWYFICFKNVHWCRSSSFGTGPRRPRFAVVARNWTTMLSLLSETFSWPMSTDSCGISL